MYKLETTYDDDAKVIRLYIQIPIIVNVCSHPLQSNFYHSSSFSGNFLLLIIILLVIIIYVVNFGKHKFSNISYTLQVNYSSPKVVIKCIQFSFHH